MALTRIHNLSISLDGFATGEPQSADAPFGHAGERLHEWLFGTRFWDAGGTAGIDDAFAQRHSDGIGAEIMGAHKFGPPGWQHDPDWTGWWGQNPPFHTPTFVLTHRRRPSIKMQGGTTFHSSTPPRPRRSRPPAKQPMARTSGSAAAPPSYATSSPPGSSTTCISSRSRSCSAAACASGTAWRPRRCLPRRGSLLPQRRHPPHVHAEGRLVNVDTERQARWADVRICRVIRALRHSAAFAPAVPVGTDRSVMPPSRGSERPESR